MDRSGNLVAITGPWNSFGTPPEMRIVTYNVEWFTHLYRR